MQDRTVEPSRTSELPGQALAGSEQAAVFAPPWSFASLISPQAPNTFYSEYWGRRPLHLARNAPDFYRDLIRLEDLERYLSMDEFFARHSVGTPSQSPGWPEPPPTSTAELAERMLRGDSLRLRRMECFMDPSAPVIALLRALELALQHPKDSLSCYVTPPGAIGLGPHHDETEIFTLQIRGTKRWRLYHRVDTDQPGIHDRAELGPPSQELVLAPGDLLYLPRGQVHEVTNEAAAFSLTIVFSPFKWSALLDLLVARLAGLSAFMEPLPAGVVLTNARPESLRQALAARIAMIQDELANLTVDALLDDLATRHLQRMTPPPETRFESLFRGDEMTLETRIERRPEMPCRLVPRDNEVVLVLAGGYTLRASARADRAFRDVLAADGPFRITAIHDILSAPAKLALARKLVSCGLFRVLPEEHPTAGAT